jgi:hypothetical protein
LASEWWNQHGHPECYPAGSGQHGKDIIRLRGHSVEVKARRGFHPLAALKQAKQNAEPGDLTYALLRMDGQGEDPGKWLAVFVLEDIAPLLPGYREVVSE